MWAGLGVGEGSGRTPSAGIRASGSLLMDSIVDPDPTQKTQEEEKTSPFLVANLGWVWVTILNTLF